MEASEVQHFEGGGPVPGPDPDDQDYGSFVFFGDPDGNTWTVRQVRQRAMKLDRR